MINKVVTVAISRHRAAISILVLQYLAPSYAGACKDICIGTSGWSAIEGLLSHATLSHFEICASRVLHTLYTDHTLHITLNLVIIIAATPATLVPVHCFSVLACCCLVSWLRCVSLEGDLIIILILTGSFTPQCSFGLAQSHLPSTPRYHLKQCGTY